MINNQTEKKRGWFYRACRFGSDATKPGEPLAPVECDPLGNPTIVWKPGEVLISDRNRSVLVKRISRLVGLPKDHFDSLYLTVINAFAEYVQQLPATENHHHARLGGLLDHSLDVAERALSLRRAHLLPPNQPPEVVARQADRWTYGVFLAALFHDLGKVPTDFNVMQFGDDGRQLGAWVSAAGPMSSTVRYHHSFQTAQTDGDHRHHTSFLARMLLPKPVLEWLCEDRTLMLKWLATLNGDYKHAGTLGIIISEADHRSVDSSAGAPAQDSIGNPINLNEQSIGDRLRACLRQFFDTAKGRVNEPGADALVTTTDLWLTSESGMRLLRQWLIGEGIVSIQGANSTIMDTLQENAICTPNQKGRALWSVKIIIGELSQEVTMLRFPIEQIWPNLAERPAPFDGILETDSLRPETDWNEAKAPANQSPTETSVGDGTAEKLRWKEVAAEFFDWLANEIEAGREAINERDGALWIVEEGLFLRSPGVYRKFVEEAGYDIRTVQKAIISQGVLLYNNKPRPTTIINYSESRVGKRNFKMSGNVLMKPQEVLKIRLPIEQAQVSRVAARDGHL